PLQSAISVHGLNSTTFSRSILTTSARQYLLSSVSFPTSFPTCTATTSTYTPSLHDALPISRSGSTCASTIAPRWLASPTSAASSDRKSTSELQSLRHLVCRLLLEKKKINKLHKVEVPLGQGNEHNHEDELQAPSHGSWIVPL